MEAVEEKKIVKKIVDKYETAQECPVTLFMEEIGGKWKPIIVCYLLSKKVMRFNELDKAINGISQKMLSQQIKDLEKIGILKKISYSEIPPKVEYCLTTKGESLMEIMSKISTWSRSNLMAQ